MKHLDLFSGIGGFALAAEEVWSNMEHIFCEIDPFCQAVLKKHWPHATIYGDIRELTAERLLADSTGEQNRRLQQSKVSTDARTDNQRIDLLTGGFPCQPFSHAGKRRGAKDDRHLWPEMLRIISETLPRWVIGENVRGLLSQEGGLVFEQVCADLENIGYEVWPLVLPAAAVGAPHRRDRVWIVARHAANDGQHGAENEEGDSQRGDGNKAGSHEVRQPQGADSLRAVASDAEERGRGERHQDTGRTDEGAGTKEERRRLAKCSRAWERDWREIALATCNDGVDDGISKRMVRLPDGTRVSRARWRREALKAYGNAIVPQVAVEIMKAIKTLKV